MVHPLISPQTEARTEIIRSLLLSAPKARRLDLAIGTLLYRVQRAYIQVVEGQSFPVWYFFDPAQDHLVFYYLAQGEAWTPKTGLEERSPHPVPAYASNPAALGELRAWLLSRGADYTLFYGKDLKATITNGQTVCEASPRNLGQDMDAQMCLLFARATVSLCAPKLIPLLDSDDESPDERRGRSFLDWPQLSSAQELVLLPVYVPVTLFERRCQYQAYDVVQGAWRFCQQKWREEDAGDEPMQCPCCGGYFCEKHFSRRTLWLDSISHPFREKVAVCQMCALLPEEDIRRLRETRLALNGR
jgi:hypothetical protein